MLVQYFLTAAVYDVFITNSFMTVSSHQARENCQIWQPKCPNHFARGLRSLIAQTLGVGWCCCYQVAAGGLERRLGQHNFVELKSKCRLCQTLSGFDATKQMNPTQILSSWLMTLFHPKCWPALMVASSRHLHCPNINKMINTPQQ